MLLYFRQRIFVFCIHAGGFKAVPETVANCSRSIPAASKSRKKKDEINPFHSDELSHTY